MISGAIHPSVPATPDRLEKDIRPILSFLHNPKSEIMARISPLDPGMDMSTFCGLISRCTMSRLWRWSKPWLACLKTVMWSKLGFWYLPSTKSCKVATHNSRAIYRNCVSCSMQKYRITLGCSSDSRNRSTSRSAMLKHAANTRLTATARESNFPLKQRPRVYLLIWTDSKNL